MRIAHRYGGDRTGLAVNLNRHFHGRAADPAEIVDFILYLASEKGAFVIGTNHVVDGGRLCVPR